MQCWLECYEQPIRSRDCISTDQSQAGEQTLRWPSLCCCVAVLGGWIPLLSTQPGQCTVCTVCCTGRGCVKHKLINIFAALHSVRAVSQISLYTAQKAAIALSAPQLRFSLHTRLSCGFWKKVLEKRLWHKKSNRKTIKSLLALINFIDRLYECTGSLLIYMKWRPTEFSWPPIGAKTLLLRWFLALKNYQGSHFFNSPGSNIPI